MKTLNKEQVNFYGENSVIFNEISQLSTSNSRIDLVDLVKILSDEILSGSIIWDKNVIYTINKAIAKIDEIISKQLSEVMHNGKFKEFEGTWRGLKYVVNHTKTNANLKIKIMNVTKQNLLKDLTKSADFDHSQLFKIVYEREFGTPGGEPFGLLVGDYQFDHSPEDIEVLSKVSNIAAAAFCPFIASSSPSLFGLTSWDTLGKPRDLEKNFEGKEYIKWNALRESDDARFITLTMPRVLARLPYGSNSKSSGGFNFTEAPRDSHGKQLPLESNNYCWMNAAFVLGERIANAYSNYQWCTAIRGAEGGGKVTNLPIYTFISSDGDYEMTCPTEVAITDRREAELSRLGFLPICHYKNTDYAVFFGAQTLQKPIKYDKPEATANATISARLPYVMATSRFAHYLKVIARDKMGSFLEASEVETMLNRWILNYVNANPDSGQDMKAKYPLAEAKVQVTAIPGKPGSYHAVAWLRPWLQLEELTTSLRLVANIPKLT